MSDFHARARYTWTLIGAVLLSLIAMLLLLGNAIEVRYERDVTRMVFNDNTRLLHELRHRSGLEHDSLASVLAWSPGTENPYIVVSIEDHRLWYRKGDSLLFTTQVATGSGRVLERSGGDSHWRFETPRGRLTVESKETDPIWVPPDWHYVEQAQRRGLGIVRLNRGQQLLTPDGALAVAGSDVVKRSPDGRLLPVAAGEEREIVAGGNIVIPPFGTNQRKYRGVLGTHRLNLGDGYALHGTDRPETIGQSVSHGCVRLKNEDIGKLYEMVPVGTPVFIY